MREESHHQHLWPHAARARSSVSQRRQERECETRRRRDDALSAKGKKLFRAKPPHTSDGAHAPRRASHYQRHLLLLLLLIEQLPVNNSWRNNNEAPPRSVFKTSRSVPSVYSLSAPTFREAFENEIRNFSWHRKREARDGARGSASSAQPCCVRHTAGHGRLVALRQARAHLAGQRQGRQRDSQGRQRDSQGRQRDSQGHPKEQPTLLQEVRPPIQGGLARGSRGSLVLQHARCYRAASGQRVGRGG